jgi:hypothetical protein
MESRKFLAYTAALAETVAGSEIGILGGIPEGHAYSVMMAHINLDEFREIVVFLKDRGLITSEGFLMKPTEKLKERVRQMKAARKEVSK